MAVKLFALSAVLLVNTGAALDLTEADWDEHTAGKSVFIKFFAPWCGHCKKLKPDWDRLMGEFEGSPTALVADVDCTADESKGLCDKNEVQGFPTLKYGDPSELKDYTGGRSFDELKAFASENLGPQCGPDHMELCSEAIQKKIETYQQMSLERLEGKVKQAYRIVEEEVPVMKKVIAHAKKNKKGEL